MKYIPIIGCAACIAFAGTLAVTAAVSAPGTVAASGAVTASGAERSNDRHQQQSGTESLSADSLFARGTRTLESGEHQAALDTYRVITASGRASGPLYYNMGLAFFRMDKTGQAIRYFEKALAYLPDNEQITHTLTLARQNTADQFAHLPPPFWEQAWNAIVRFFGVAGLFAVGFIGYLSAVGLFVAGRIVRSRAAWRRWAQGAALAIAVLFLAAAFGASAEQAAPSRAVILATETPMRTSPQAGAARTALVHEGTTVDILGTSDTAEWTRVRLSNGMSGWITAQALGTI